MLIRCVRATVITLGAHAQEGCRVCVCVCVCVWLCVPTPAPTSLVSTLKMGVILSFSRFVLRGLSINPSVQKLWREKANMQMSSYCSRFSVDGSF